MGVMFSMRVGATITLIGATLDSGTIGSVFELLANQLCRVLFLFISTTETKIASSSWIDYN